MVDTSGAAAVGAAKAGAAAGAVAGALEAAAAVEVFCSVQSNMLVPMAQYPG